MSDLHDLASPIEEPKEEVSKTEVKKYPLKKSKLLDDFIVNLKIVLHNFWLRYSKKLFLSVGIAVTLGLTILWLVSLLMNRAPAVEEKPNPPEQQTNNNVQDQFAKFTKFEGHQYFFYFPDNLDHLNRTRNDDLNEVQFSYDNGAGAFLLQEFESDNDNETTLDSIYSYTATSMTPSENNEVKIGDNTFKHRVYKDCSGPAPTSSPEGDLPASVSCVLGDEYYSIYINGIVVLFSRSNDGDKGSEKFKDTILKTFAKNVVDSGILTDDYVRSNIPNVKNKLNAYYKFGAPSSNEQNNEATEITWNISNGDELQIGFDSNKNLEYAHENLPTKMAKFDILSDIKNSGAAISSNAAISALLANRTIQKAKIADKKLEIFVEDNPADDNFWEATVTTTAKDTPLKYTVTKDTGKVEALY